MLDLGQLEVVGTAVGAPGFGVLRTHEHTHVVVQLLQGSVTVGIELGCVGGVQLGQGVGQVQNGVDAQSVGIVKGLADQSGHFQEAAGAGTAADGTDDIDLILALLGGDLIQVLSQNGQCLNDLTVDTGLVAGSAVVNLQLALQTGTACAVTAQVGQPGILGHEAADTGGESSGRPHHPW